MIMSSNASSYDLLSSIPDCIWLKIFSKLDAETLIACSRVCAKWRRISYDRSLIADMDLTQTPIGVGGLRKVLNFSAYSLVSLKVRGHWRKGSKNCPQESIDFDEETKRTKTIPTITKKIMSKMRNKCPNLRHLHLEHIYDDMFLSYLPPNLTHLSLIHCEIIFELLFIASNRHQSERKVHTLKCLNVSFCDMIESRDCLILNQFLSLRVLFMEGLMRINDGGISLINTNIIANLVVVDFEATDVKDETFFYLLSNGNSLKEVYLGQTQVTANINFRECLKIELKKLCLIHTAVNEFYLKNILKHYPSLIWLNCDHSLSQIFANNWPCIQSIEPQANANTCLHYNKHKCDDYLKDTSIK